MVHHHRSPTMEPNKLVFLLQLPLFLSLLAVAYSATDPNDLAILNQFKKGLKNPELLNWPANDADPCGSTTKWNNTVFCSGNRVTQIQVQGYGLSGPLPQNLNQLSMLQNVGFQKNLFTGALPSFSGLTHLQYAYLDYNQFDTIPADFFNGLSSLEVLALDYINLNASTGWMFPTQLGDAAQLRNLSCMKCNLMFWLNNQQGGGGLTGPIDVVTTMSPLNSLWLHGNQFTGTIPESIGDLTLLKDLNLNGNKLVGLIPDSLANLALDTLDLSNNMLMGPIPKFKAKTVAFASNMFCQTTQGLPCAPAVVALIEFLGGLNYPSRLVSSWTGNDPCGGPWLGLSCSSGTEVNNINMPNFTLSGTLSPAVARLGSLIQIRLQNNNLSGPIPGNWTSLKYLTSLDLSGNNISPPLPSFNSTVKLNLVGNLLLNGDQSPPSGNTPSSGGSQSPSNNPSGSNGNGTSNVTKKPNSSKRSILVSVVAPVASVAVVAFLAVPLSVYFCKKRKDNPQAPSSVVIHPRDPSDLDNTVKIVVTNNTNGSTSAITGSGSGSRNSSGMGESHVIESGNLIISVQVLRNVTKNFSSENELGRGGFGVVYKGELDDGTKIAVKRMEAGIITNKALDEFQSEIAVLSKVRHRHLVSLLGYSIEGNERILVYEYMPQGALSKHLFHWKSFKMEPLSWKRRLNIALDVARGMEYLHSLAHQSFIHRDLKSSNILLGDDFRAKVSDFGLVKLAPDGAKSVETRLAGTFGYLAPEYAVTGKITTKADVFSFGVVLMELLTGLMALDEDRPEETQYLAAWFWHIKSDQEKLMAAIDPALDINEETLDSISTIADLAGHCTAREPGQRPDMGHAVNVLAPLVEKWKPFDDDNEEYSGIDYSLPLNQMVKGWQEGKDLSYMALEDSKDSIPARPAGFAESFTSADGR
nr:receptor-like kinase tmk3 [Quercus suber]